MFIDATVSSDKDIFYSKVLTVEEKLVFLYLRTNSFSTIKKTAEDLNLSVDSTRDALQDLIGQCFVDVHYRFEELIEPLYSIKDITSLHIRLLAYLAQVQNAGQGLLLDKHPLERIAQYLRISETELKQAISFLEEKEILYTNAEIHNPYTCLTLNLDWFAVLHN